MKRMVLFTFLALVLFVLAGVSCKSSPEPEAAEEPVVSAPVVSAPQEKIPVTLAEKLAWVQEKGESNSAYAIEIDSDESISPTTLSYGGKTLSLTITGISAERIISLSSNGSLFTVEDGVTLTLGRNVTLQGQSGNDAALVQV
ncbi:MAG: hypothetical protein LBH97_03085, partial [Treponema sp.]|nr:hypothetical protein [Treponema sp.]